MSIPAQPQRLITLAFLKPVKGDPCMNRLTGKCSENDVCHVEIVFKSTNDVNNAFSVIYGEMATMRERSMSNPNYTTVTLGVNTNEYDKCFSYCKHIDANQYAFDNVGMYLSFFYLGGCWDPAHATFCSKAITLAMQAGGIPEVQGLVPGNVTPSRLYAAVKGSKRVVLDVLTLKLIGTSMRIPRPVKMTRKFNLVIKPLS